jgi:large subunit ribosomal protein L6
MSRIGNKPITIPAGVSVAVEDRTVHVEGPKGKLSWQHRPEVALQIEGDTINVKRHNEHRTARALHGLTRAVVQNMVLGVKDGYEKRLEIVGVGYICALKEKDKGREKSKILQLRVGFANEVELAIPEELHVTCPDQTHVVVQGCDKHLVGQFAAQVRAVRKPEPYKGKGIRYQGEHVKIKPGKAAT